MNHRTQILCFVWLVAARVMAADTAPAPASNDWRLLWPDSKKEEWIAKPEKELRALAQTGHAAAQYALHRKNWGTDEATRMLDAAVAAGLPQALFDKHFSLPPSGMNQTPESWAMLQQAAASGYPKARLMVGQFDAGLINDGSDLRNRLRFPPPNLPRAVAYLRDAVDQGLTEGLIPLALLYSTGSGEPRNEEDSPQKLLLAAARAGEREAYRHLAHRSLYGQGVERDLLEAARWAYFDSQFQGAGWGLGLVDEQGKAKAQTRAELQDLAELVALFVAVADRSDPETALALAERHARAAKWEPAVVLYRLAAKWGKAVPAQQRAAEARLTETQLRKADRTTDFPALP